MINSVGINSYYQVSGTNNQSTLSNQALQTKPTSEAGNVDTAKPMPERQFDFTSMTLQEQSDAAHALYEQGYLSMGEMAFMTGEYGLIKHDGQLGGKTLAQAQSEKFNVITQMKEDLAGAKQQGTATPEVIKNYQTLINKLEVYQYGFNASA
ncbi:hypothetical protein [Pseudoalteromonas luteoviolacea]|uniref:hypothetical protein n=1 Tax=Pseudoalteromonas luteoviolacea TaxID=43657 RepID=UPI0011509D2D|nr:hypothetical protein [Pseudoalteromonas luteoviolacea]TQF71071.1 hypothetical protein FLM44_08275 [Pseudoalteromonas luteoviolacea]